MLYVQKSIFYFLCCCPELRLHHGELADEMRMCCVCVLQFHHRPECCRAFRLRQVLRLSQLTLAIVQLLVSKSCPLPLQLQLTQHCLRKATQRNCRSAQGCRKLVEVSRCQCTGSCSSGGSAEGSRLLGNAGHASLRTWRSCEAESAASFALCSCAWSSPVSRWSL